MKNTSLVKRLIFFILFFGLICSQKFPYWERKFIVSERDPRVSISDKGEIKHHSMLISQSSPNQYSFKMDGYNPEYMGTEDESHYVIPDEYSFKTKLNIPMNGEIIHSLKLKNNFSELEIEMSKNDCLTLFFFLDATSETDIIINRNDSEVILESSSNNLLHELQTIHSLNNGHFVVVDNNLSTTNDYIYLKAFCPFYSTYLNKEVFYHLQEIPQAITSRNF